MYRIGIYEKALPQTLSWEEKLREARAMGFDFVEMSVDETEERLNRLEWDESEISRLYSLQKKTGIMLESICFSAQRKYPLGSGKWEREAKEILEKAVIFAKKMGIRIIQAQGYDCYYEEKSSEETRNRFFENLRKGVMFAASHGVILGIETMENDFMNTTEKVMKAVREVDSPYLQVYPDIGNIWNGSKTPLQDLETGRGHIVAAHLKETVPGKFREVPYGEGQVNFPAAIRSLYSLGVRRFVAEFWHCGEENWRQIGRQNREFLEGKFLEAGITRER